MRGKTIVIASGKGGTGKTTVSTSLALYAAGKENSVTLCDCDVEEPDDNLFLNVDIKSRKVYTPVPKLDEKSCSSCGKCADVCFYNAIVMVNGRPLIFPDLCHGCRGCQYACEDGAISLEDRHFGNVEEGNLQNLKFFAGRLNIKEVLSPALIREVKRSSVTDDLRIIDAPPGSACAAVTALSGASFVILVGEPTPFGYHDFHMVYTIVAEMEIPCGVVINKYRNSSSLLEEFCIDNEIPLLARIPENLDLAKSYSRGHVTEYMLQECEGQLEEIYNAIGTLI